MSIYPYLRLLLDSDSLAFFTSLWQLGKRWLQSPQGLYEVLDYEATLELCDSKGKKAIFRKQQRVRFLQNNVTAYQDQAFGDGELFADYQCSPGKAVDRYLHGDIYYVLISLRETKNRGDIEEIHIKRTIQDGFTSQRGYFQNRVSHTMQHFSSSVIFPRKRPPRNLTIIEHQRNRTHELNPNHIRTLPDGRIKVTWETSNPRLHEMYSIRWDW